MIKSVITTAHQKERKFMGVVSAAITSATLMVRYPYAFFAAGNFVDVEVDIDNIARKFDDPNAVTELVVGIALWICQMVGLGMLVWGIYGYVTARKDGEAEAMNGALGKLISGCVLIGMKGILKAMGILA